MLQAFASDDLQTELPSRVKVIVTAGTHILVLKKTNGEWDLPGGRRDPGESLEQTLQREFLEETGIFPWGARFMENGWRMRTNKPPVWVAFFAVEIDRARLLSGLQLSAEHDAAQLVMPDILAQLTMPPLYAQMAAQWLATDKTSR